MGLTNSFLIMFMLERGQLEETNLTIGAVFLTLVDTRSKINLSQNVHSLLASAGSFYLCFDGEDQLSI